MSVVDLNSLPAISFAPQNAAQVEADILTACEKLAQVTLQPGDPVRLFLESLAYYVSVENGLIDLTGRQNLLAFASGAHLDHLGALMGVARIPAQNSLCLLRFQMAAPLAFAVPVPAGTRVATRDGKTVFATISAGALAAGEVFVDLAACAVLPGSDSTGLVPGQINSLVDPIPYVTSVENITTSSEGADIESDERLRERIRLAPESYTVAGSTGQYEARALEASADIEYVTVFSPEPGLVDVRFTLTGGELPDRAMIALVYDHLNADTVRPLTDWLHVAGPEPVEYAIRGRWHLARENAPLLAAVTAKIAEALENYRLWQRAKPGRDIIPSKLVEMLMGAGAKRVEIDTPVFTRLRSVEIARETEINLLFGGLEDE